MTVTPHRMFEQRWPEGDFRLFQLGFVVPDLLESAAHWVRVFGIGPFHVMPRTEEPCKYRGADSSMEIQVGIAQAGPVQIELIKDHTEGASVYRDLADIHGGKGFGLHQLATVTSDYDAKTAHYQQLGYTLACELKGPGQRVAFLDTVEDFGYFIEVIEEKPSFLANVSKISQTCAEWDGTDPIRLMTRDGYRTP